MQLHCVWMLTLFAIASCASPKKRTLQSELGMAAESQPRLKRRPSERNEDRQMVTIDLSALRPSLPGLVLYKYGDVAPKLVQVDLSSLNPQLQPHVIWPQFDLLDLVDERPLDFDNIDAIPYLSEEDPLLPPKPHRFAKVMDQSAGWSGMQDIADGDIYDFLPDSRRNDELMALHGNLPLADEVIVPLDWEEEKSNGNSEKRNVFASSGWQAGGHRAKGNPRAERKMKEYKGTKDTSNIHYTPFGSNNWVPGKRKLHPGIETESDDATGDAAGQRPDTTLTGEPGKKNVFISNGWGPSGKHVSMTAPRRHGGQRRVKSKDVKIASQETWSLPRQYWSVPHLFGNHWQ